MQRIEHWDKLIEYYGGIKETFKNLRWVVKEIKETWDDTLTINIRLSLIEKFRKDLQRYWNKFYN